MIANKIIMKCVCSACSGFFSLTISSESVCNISFSSVPVKGIYQKLGIKAQCIWCRFCIFLRKLTSPREARDRFPIRSIIQQKRSILKLLSFFVLLCSCAGVCLVAQLLQNWFVKQTKNVKMQIWKLRLKKYSEMIHSKFTILNFVFLGLN